MKSSITSREISEQGQALVEDRLRGLGFTVVPAPAASGSHLIVSRGGGSVARRLWVTANLKPKPGGGSGPLTLNWQIRRNVSADVIGLVDLSTKKVWLLLASEVERIPQQHNPTYHHMIMVARSDWTSAPHSRIRVNQFEDLLLERRAESLFGDEDIGATVEHAGKSPQSGSINAGHAATAYILTWNPDNWHWAELAKTVAHVRSGEALEDRWSSGNTKTIPIGSRVFLLRQGVEPRGIMASGWTTAEPEEGPHWDQERRRRGDLANFVGFAYEAILDPESEPLLDPRDFPPGPVQDVHWAPPASGTSIPTAAAAQLERLWANHIEAEMELGFSDPELSAVEGTLRLRLVKHRSRERALRRAKLAAATRNGPLCCEVPGCSFDFERRYGPLGRGYAQVHHLTPLASLDKPAPVSLSDLAVVCANCHVMIHVGGKARPLKGLIPARVSGRKDR
jgi:5-methylcytosine-specific restriction protein A